MLLSQLIQTFEKRIPLTLQEKWDHCGLNLGNPRAEVTRVLFAYDVCMEVLKYAKQKKCELVVSHHPFRMSADVNLRLDHYEGRMIEFCLKHNIALYSSHTNHDASAESLNFHYLKKLGLKNIKPLSNCATPLYKLIVYVPQTHSQKIMDALFMAGAGQIGNYGECSFRTAGTGTFKGDENTNPAIGKKMVREEIKEDRIETIVKDQDLSRTLSSMKAAHPYEEVAYDVFPLLNRIEGLGLGAFGISEKPLAKAATIQTLKKIFHTKNLRFIDGGHKKFTRIGICTGSGASFLSKAMALKLDLFITGDVKYHQAIEAKRHDLSIADVGHFYSEKDSVLVLKNIFETLFSKHIAYHSYNYLSDAFKYY